MMIRSNWIPPFKLALAYFPRCKMGPRFPLWLKGQRDVSFLDISDAGIVDNLPDWFWVVFSNVQYLNVSFNQISARLPRTLEFMSSAEIFVLNSNNFTGTLPQLPKHLVELDISKNYLSGPVPQKILERQTFQIYCFLITISVVLFQDIYVNCHSSQFWIWQGTVWKDCFPYMFKRIINFSSDLV
jgi:hypothetical protein